MIAQGYIHSLIKISKNSNSTKRTIFCNKKNEILLEIKVRVGTSI